jgi:beta-galactosidase
MKSHAFAPKISLDAKRIQSLLKTPSLLSNAKVVMVDSEALGYEATNAIDDNPKTLWHTSWEPTPAPYPHEIQIELPESTIKGFTYLPRQDMTNGWIERYEVYISDDGQSWGAPAASGQFEKGRAEKKVLFSDAHKGRFFRFVALSGFDGQAFASAAEINLITE